MSSRSSDAFAHFYRENLRALRGYIARLMPGAADAEDIANEAFTRVLAATSADRPVPPRAYLFSAAHNLAMNHHRRHRMRGEAPLDEETAVAVADPSPPVDRDLIARERLKLLWEAVDQLPPRCRQVFLMRKIDNMSNQEIAEKLGMSVSAVEKHILKGLRACRAYLDAREGKPAEEANHG